MAPSTARVYDLALKSFHQFRVEFGLKCVWPAPLEDVVSFIGYLYKLGLAYSTVNCYISGLSFFSKINNFEDSTQRFVVRKMIEGVKRSRSPQKDPRLPISRVMLRNILSILSSLCSNNYESKLFKAAFSMAFHGFFRVGELTVGQGHVKNHTVEWSNVHIFEDYLEVYLSSSKTDQFGKGVTIHIPASHDKNICPLFLIKSFLQDRPAYDGPLFCHFDGKPLTRYQFSSILRKSLPLIGIANASYTSHSFRIGMATTCALDNMPDVQIQKLGRWKSNAYLSYIRIPKIN